jgi:methylenetetrahydrofolate reductase (NADPH)
MSASRSSSGPNGSRSVTELIRGGGHSFSFEFFPPKDAEGERQLWRALRQLEPLRPTFVSVTYGAGGSTGHRTVGITHRIARETTMVPMAHLTCVGHSRDELRSVIGSYAAAGIRNVLVLRGDPPGGPGTPWQATEDGLSYASELVELVRSLGRFSVGVAAFAQGHREAASLEHDVEILARKEAAGAGFAITDMFFRASDYLGLVDRASAAGVTMPILPGIMPITNLGQVRRMAELSGHPVPEEVVSRIARYDGDPEAVRSAGIELATELCETVLANGAPGLHFYTLNRSKATREIYANLERDVTLPA